MLLYGVIFDDAPGEEAAKWIIEAVVDAPPGPFGSGPGPSRDKYRAAIRRALATTDPLTDLADNARPDLVTRSFLAAILRRLDEAITRKADARTTPISRAARPRTCARRTYCGARLCRPG
jgi:hypothetical protein